MKAAITPTAPGLRQTELPRYLLTMTHYQHSCYTLSPDTTPCRHLAASEGSYKVTEWLLEQRVDVNAVDRFNRTPLEVRR